MKSLFKSFMMVIALVILTACVPAATEKKALCGSNQVFNTISRSCYSVEVGRAPPVGTKTSDTLVEEVPKTITLTYTDINKDPALFCKVSAVSSNVEVVSPLIFNGGLFDKADELYQAAYYAAVEMAVSTTAMQTALLKAKASFSYPTLTSQMGIFRVQVNAILSLAGVHASPVVQNYNTQAQQKLVEYDALMVQVANRCECSAGICTTTVIPRLHKNGAAGFSYTLTDVDGEGAVKAVALSISAMSATTSHLKPVAQSTYDVFAESNTSVATSYAITLPGGADLNGTASSGFTYTFDGVTTGSSPNLVGRSKALRGNITGCMNLMGTSGVNDLTCVFTPDSGDAFDAITTAKATVTMGDLTFEAVSAGTNGNNFTIQYFNLQSDNTSVDPYITKMETFGLVNPSYNESFIRVVGNSIQVFINPGTTTSDDIKNMLNSHPQASLLVVASTIVTPTGTLPTSTGQTSLTGGVDAFDSFAYKIKNSAGAESSSSATAMMKITSVDDVPVLNSVGATTATAIEDAVSVVVDLSPTFSDVDTDDINYFNVCNIDPLDTFLTNFNITSCTCVLATCSMTIVPHADVSSIAPFTFHYRIGSTDGVTTNYTAYKLFSLTMTPVNDAPVLTLGAASATIPEGGSGFFDIDIDPGGSGWESTQVLTVTATSSDTALLPVANIVVSDLPTPVAGKKSITYTPVANRSGPVTITVVLKDDQVLNNTTTANFALTVTPVDNPPVFLSTITTIDTNEGGAIQSDAFQVDEDAGSSPDEDVQATSISSIATDNHSVLPPASIKIFYDLNDNGVEDIGESRAVGATLENAASDDVKLHKFYLKLDPVDGVSGNANVVLTVSDGTNTATTNFSFIVHPIAALHGGWANISSVGIKTDKNGTPVGVKTDTTTGLPTLDSDIQCNYNLRADTKNCGTTNDCTGGSPHNSITPTAKNVLYWDSANKRCYRSTAATKYSWVEFNTSCPVTRKTGLCTDDNNCIVDDPGMTDAPKNSLIPSAVGLYYYNLDESKCFVSTDKKLVTDWQEFTPSKVTLKWKDFTMVGSGPESAVQIAGWNVYRREKGFDYDFKGGHLKNASSTAKFTITDPSIKTFTDTTAIAGKVYYYVVRPVDNAYDMVGATRVYRNFPTYTPEIFSEVRVLAAPANYAFVHRWIVNLEICNGMNVTTTTTPNRIDQSNNYRCQYHGPGQSATAPGYYDYGKDLLVDTQEMGCPYSPASTPSSPGPKCSANGCIGIGAPTPSMSNIVANDVYYDRNSGSCYIYDGAAWSDFESAASVSSVAASLNSALNSPLVNVTETKAAAICSVRSAPAGTDVTFGSAPILPSKKDYNAYASQRTDLLDPQVTELEQGFSLNIESRCNGSGASGLEGSFTDSSIPSTSLIYSIPGTFSSGIRSLYTGSVPWGTSKGTEACVSRFGIQDLYGNVAEWTTDQMDCTDPYICNATATSSYYSYDYGTSEHYGFDLKSGPYNDADGDGTTAGVDAYLTQWLYADLLFNATKFSYPIGLPINSNIASVYAASPAINYVSDIGPSSGVTINKLHEDSMIVNGKAVFDSVPVTFPRTTAIGSFAVGGSYLSGNKAGRFTAELIPATVKRVDVGFRCIIPIDSVTGYPSAAASNHTYPY